jgi:hypothetical protein
VHAGCVKFDDAFFIRQSAESHRLIVGIELLMLTPAMTASRVSAFWRVIISYALATPRMPLAEAMTTGGAAK